MDSLLSFGSTHVLLSPTLKDSKFSDDDAGKSNAITDGAANDSASAVDDAGKSCRPKAKVGAPLVHYPSCAALKYEDVVLDIKNVFNFTEHVVDWHGLGLQLELQNSRLKKIHKEHLTEDDRRREMIHVWMYSDPEASWEKLSEALKRIEHRVLAEKIVNEVIPLHQRGPMTVPKPYQVRKGAPPMPYVMESALRTIPIQSDEPDYPKEAPRLPPQPWSTGRHIQQDCNTNILMLKLGVLSKPCKSHTGDPVVCSNDQCTAILNYKSKITEVEGGPKKVWVCEFCNTTNTIEIEAGEIPKEGDILYLEERQRSSRDDMLVSGITKDSVVVFCIDTSGSMGVTTEVPGRKELKNEALRKLKEIYAGNGVQYLPRQPRNITYISRMQCVQAAIDHQLTLLAQNNPSQRVAVVMFGDEVTVTGDGKPENEIVFVGEKLWKENAMLKLAKEIPTPSPIKETQALLSERIFSIEEEGQTALGGALLVSVELAKHAPGSKVILCTDGLANRGIGQLDDPKSRDSSAVFFKKVGTTAKESSVSVSVLTIKGTECDLVHLGQVANLSGGNVDVVDPMSLSDEFVNILSNSIVAVRVNAKIVLHSALCFKDGDAKSTLSVPVGNVMDTTNLMYEFSNTEKTKQDASAELQDIPFQVQVKYTCLSGEQCLRVFTAVRPSTSDKKVTLQGANDAVLGVFGLHKEGNRFLDHNGPQALSRRLYCRRRATISKRCIFEHARSSRMADGMHFGIDSCEDFVELQSGQVQASNNEPLRARPSLLRMKRRTITLDKESMVATSPRRMNASDLEGVELHRQASITKARPVRCSTSTETEDPNYYHQLENNCLSTVSASSVNVYSNCSFSREGGVEDEMAAAAFQQVQVGVEAMNVQHTVTIQKCITLEKEPGYGFGFLVSSGKEGGTVVQSLLPNGVAWKNGELRKGDRLLTINGESIGNLSHQEVVKKLRELNEDTTNTITLCVIREEMRDSEKVVPTTQLRSLKHSSEQSDLSDQMQTSNEPSELVSVTLQSEGPDGFGLTFNFNDSEHLIVEEIQSDGIADKDGRLRINDQVLLINGEVSSGKAIGDISLMVKDIEESNGSIELLVKRGKTVVSSNSKELKKNISSWMWPTTASRTSIQDHASNFLTFTLQNEGYGFGFTVKEGPKENDGSKKESVIVSTVFPDSVAYKDAGLMTGDKLVEINGKKVSDMTYQEVIATLRALNEDDDSTVSLRVERQ